MRLVRADNSKSGLSLISGFEYQRDKVGSPISILRDDGSVVYSQYDRKHQLTKETQRDDQSADIYAWEWQYDLAGNRTYQSFNGEQTYYTYDNCNRLTHEIADGVPTYYQFDNCGNQTGKQEGAGTTYFQYNYEKLMTQIDFPDGSHNYFTYDADSKRTSKGDSEGYSEFIYQGPNMLALMQERDGGENTQVDKERWPLRAAIASFQEAAEKYAGTAVVPLALAAVGRTYLKYERPERAVEFLEEALKQIEEGRLFREKMVAALETARRQIVAKQGMVAKLLWEATVGAESRRDEPYLPLLAGDRLYVRGLTEVGGPGLLCLDSNSGENLWEAAAGGTVSTRLLDDSIVVSTSHGTIVLLDAATGEQRWRHEFGPRRIGKVVCDAAGQSIVAYWDQGLLCALQPDRGEIICQQDLLTERPNLVSDGARLYHWDDDLRLRAVRLSDGTPVWTWDWRALLPEIELNGYRRGEFGGPILRAGQVICKVYGEEPLLVALSPETGEVFWTTKPAMHLGRFVPAASSGEAQFTCAGYAGLHSYSSEDGSLLWSLSLGYPSDAVAVAAHFLLVPSLEGLLVLDRGRGELVGKSRELRFGEDRVFGNDPICRGIVAEEAREGIRVYLVTAQTTQAWQLRVPRQ